ncbi:hypothetical protein [Nocardia vinacea]|uniref:hypothetical protein n=1 Tax=Nocardia vinacea TaxID=96468 RepID=UPI0002DEDF05|nr:hypothetical protein [Nocardia vinacea]
MDLPEQPGLLERVDRQEHSEVKDCQLISDITVRAALPRTSSRVVGDVEHRRRELPHDQHRDALRSHLGGLVVGSDQS